MNNLNEWAVLVAALSSFAVGGLWYSPIMFLKLWNREAGVGETPKPGPHPARVFGIAFVFALVSAWVFAWWLGPNPELEPSVVRGVAAGLGIAGASFGINYQFANRSLAMWAIDAGYHTVQFVLYAVILSLWH